MSLTIHHFNVGHGDSCIVMHEDDCCKRYIVIDSNKAKRGGKSINPAYVFLKKNNVEFIDMLIVTHLHFDHLYGIEDFFENFKIKRLILPPIFSNDSDTHNKLIIKYKDKIREAYGHSKDDEVIGKLNSLARLLHFASNNEHLVEEGAGYNSEIMIPGADDLRMRIYLPVKKMKGLLHQKIIEGNFDLSFFPDMNDASVVLSVEYKDKKILFSADSTLKQWDEQKRLMCNNGITNLGVLISKASHHGSKDNNDNGLFEYQLKTTEEKKYIVVSANGKTHPHVDFFKLIKQFNLTPFCTNLSNLCRDPKIFDITQILQFPKESQFFVKNYSVENQMTACQGDITIEIDNSGKVVIFNSTGISCVYANALLPTPQKILI